LEEIVPPVRGSILSDKRGSNVFYNLHSDEEEAMITMRFICKNCGETFTVQIFEKGEAEEKRMAASPVHCPKCRSTAIERR
jgi:transposase-like protein